MKAYTFSHWNYGENFWAKKFYASIDDLVLALYEDDRGEILELTYDDLSLPTITGRWELYPFVDGHISEIEDEMEPDWIAYSAMDNFIEDREIVIFVEPKRRNLFLP